MLLVRHLLFVSRCAAAAALSYLLTQWVGLPHPVWAVMSGLIVSQERLNDTRRATLTRFGGTLAGVAVAVLTGLVLLPLHLDLTAQMAIAVAICAALSRVLPCLRVSLWTVPAVFLTATPPLSIWDAGLDRGVEVILGGLVGAALHQLAELAAGIAPDHSCAQDGPQE